jgi:hypothetical protein
MSDTPETDALNATHGDDERGWVVEYGEMFAHARQLERQRDEAAACLRGLLSAWEKRTISALEEAKLDAVAFLINLEGK